MSSYTDLYSNQVNYGQTIQTPDGKLLLKIFDPAKCIVCETWTFFAEAQRVRPVCSDTCFNKINTSPFNYGPPLLKVVQGERIKESMGKILYFKSSEPEPPKAA